MTDCMLPGHAQTAIVTQHEQGPCCDPNGKAYYPLQKGHMYLEGTPLQKVDGVYQPMTDPAQEMCGFRPCDLDATEWTVDCEATICKQSHDLIPSTVAWPKEWGEAEIKTAIGNACCCFTFRAVPDCCPPDHPILCDDEAAEEPKE